METQAKRINDAMELIMYGRTDEAIGILWQVQAIVDRLESEALERMTQSLIGEFRDVQDSDGTFTEDDQGNWHEVKKLPPMKPIRKAKKRIRAVDVVCPSCGAQPGQQCHRMTKRGTGGEPIPGEYVNHNHNPRIHRARNL